ncbi:MAG: ParB/RepB/Spo0J family partition protein [Lachnospiraceae bacterium]|nr:ParB/RepB/Spo0J family partition protein [Lachnospiraceae bacterium]
MTNTEFDDFIQAEVEKQKGVSIPVRAGLLERLLTRKMNCRSMLPNPDDEFCFPDIGPNYGIISNYMKSIRKNVSNGLNPFEEPVFVEKLSPKGYRLLNGHHRWAAALQLGIKRIPAKIVNLPLESDITAMIENSRHDRRVTLDLDEVIFRDESDPNVEKPRRGHKERIRQGVPALFHFLTKKGYDIWVYSSNYYSIDDIQSLFRAYSANVDGIITGIAKQNTRSSEADKRMKELIANKYKKTIHIDNDSVVITGGPEKKYAEFPIDAPAERWAAAVTDIIAGIKEEEAE